MSFLDWVGFLSLNLGIFNLLPIPFLDGGRFAFIVLEAARRRRVDPRLEQMVHAAGLMLILALVVYVTLTGDIGGRS
jgi:regulator of sigma E protease